MPTRHPFARGAAILVVLVFGALAAAIRARATKPRTRARGRKVAPWTRRAPRRQRSPCEATGSSLSAAMRDHGAHRARNREARCWRPARGAGIIEGHGHFMSLGESLGMLDLRTSAAGQRSSAWSRRRGGGRSRANGSVARAGTRRNGRRCRTAPWKACPRHAALDGRRTAQPGLIEHASGHGVLANAAALETAGIDDRHADPEGGHIVRDARGHATGWLVDNAPSLYAAAIDKSFASRCRRSQRRPSWSRGCGAPDGGAVARESLLSTMRAVLLRRSTCTGRSPTAGELPVRLYVMVGSESNDSLERHLASLPHCRRREGGFLTVRAIKRTADGALGSRSALVAGAVLGRPVEPGAALSTAWRRSSARPRLRWLTDTS